MNWIARIQRRPTLVSILAIVLYALALHAPAIFTPGQLIGVPGGDADQQFAPWRAFAFENLKNGKLPEWNPHIFGGVPFLEGWQSALFYPPNWIGLILPLEVTLNLHLWFHASIVGIGMWLWLRGRGVSNLSSILGAIIVFSAGTWFARVYWSMHANFASMAWTPLMLWSIDRLVEKPFDRRALFVGILSLSLTLLGGHPQYTYYLILFSILYSIYRWTRLSNRNWKFPASMSLIGLLALMLTAIQWLPALDVSNEFLRGRKLEPGFAAAYSLPSENLITAVAPDAFGRPNGVRPETPDYWGRGFYWEASAFFGVGVLVLAIVGATSIANRRANWPAIIAVFVGVILSIGYDTPIWELLYSYFPGWGQFRGMSKLLFYVSIVVALLAARGVDRLRLGFGRRHAIIGVGILSFILLIAASIAYEGTDPKSNGIWRDILNRMIGSRESAYESVLGDPSVASKFAQATLRQLLWTLPWFIAAIGATLLRGRWSAIALSVIALAGLVCFDRNQLESVAIDRPLSESSNQTLEVAGKDARVIFNQMADQNQGMRSGFESAWGVDPLVLKRWFEVLALASTQSPDSETPNLRFRESNWRLLAMLRVGAVLQEQSKAPIEIPDPAPLAFVPKHSIVVTDRDQRLLTLLDPSFDPKQIVILETDQNLPNESIGSVSASWIDSDSLKLTADLDTRAAVVITNAYARGWSARSVASDEEFEVVAADHALQAVVLSAGKHEMVLEYRARLLPVGAIVSAVGLVVLSLMFFTNWRVILRE